MNAAITRDAIPARILDYLATKLSHLQSPSQVSHHLENELLQPSVQPTLGVVLPQLDPRSMSNDPEQFLKGHQSIPKPEPDAASQARLVRTAQ